MKSKRNLKKVTYVIIQNIVYGGKTFAKECNRKQCIVTG